MSDGLNLFLKEASNLEDLLLELSNVVLTRDPPSLDGEISLIDKNNEVIDTYNIRIVPTDTYPNEFPKVYELNGRLPKNIDWHIYPDGHFCIKSYPEEILICYKGISLSSFIKGELIPYLFNQKFREENGYFLKERSHGIEGNLEFFKDIFRTPDLQKIKKYLLFILRRRTPSRTSKCFCGSGNKFRKCHRDAYNTINSLPDEYIQLYLKIIELQ